MGRHGVAGSLIAHNQRELLDAKKGDDPLLRDFFEEYGREDFDIYYLQHR